MPVRSTRSALQFLERLPRAAWAACVVLLVLGGTRSMAAAEDADGDEPLRLRSVDITGNDALSKSRIRGEMLLQPRSWYAFWRDRPELDEAEVARDLAKIERAYVAHGYYQTNARYELDVDPDEPLADLKIEVSEGEPIEVRDLLVVVDGERVPQDEVRAIADLPIAVGKRFEEEDYRESEELLRQAFLERGFARVQVRREAKVDVYTDLARVTYEIDRGPECVFGTTTIEGTEDVAREIVAREIRIEPGDPFRPAAISEARGRLLDLGLFGVVRILADEPGERPEIVDLRVTVDERPPRAFTIGVGYGTEDEFRTQLAWSHKNWLGGGRQLSARAKYSSLLIAGGIQFVQPHFLSPRNRLIVDATHDQLDEDTYRVNETQLRPRLEHSLTSNLTLALGYRVARIAVHDVTPETAMILDVRRHGWISGPSLTLIHDDVDDELDPSRGGVALVGALHSGEIWGATFDYYKLWTETKRYFPLPWKLVLALRGRVATVDPLGPDNEVPVHERLFAGGDGSIRGFGRRRLGPRAPTDEPIGGLSLIEASVELRRRIWGSFGAAVFLDAGHLATDSYDFRFGSVEPAAGFGVSYQTPVGPLRLDIGFPFDPPPNDTFWQIHFSVGHYF